MYMEVYIYIYLYVEPSIETIAKLFLKIGLKSISVIIAKSTVNTSRSSKKSFLGWYI